ncbi:hypothetical protein OHA27_37980 [Streptomyces sp. NBC_01619]|uniref:hypothetical protein n=1 Tax=Streptomyces sp. NBC_01619 TaxID=2975901 RepID=UPI0022583796|nr:hypothetical protein [Streptomyces sp. NBC_01619]MCX4515911.1 hypothetical protein [Streptomyces sp. NBC_01619]
MNLDPRRPALCVAQATVVGADGSATTVARAMPAAPFGTPAWQLPVVAGYLGRLRRAGDAPSIGSFVTYLDSRAGGSRVPAPHRPYAGMPWHDTRATCVIDVLLTSRGSMGWPAVSLVVLQQEVGRRDCSWSRVERHRGYLAVARHTADEIAAERDRLADRLRTTDDDNVRQVHALATEVTTWADKLHRAARGGHTLARAADVRKGLQVH